MKNTLNYNDTNDEVWKKVTENVLIKNLIFIIFGVFFSLIDIKFNNVDMVISISMAFLIAAISNDVPVIGIVVGEAITLTVRLGLGGLATYLFEIILFVLSIFFLKPIEITFDSEKYKFGRRLIIVTVIASFLTYVRSYPFYAVLELTIFSFCIEYVFYKVFSNGINVMNNLKKFKAFSEIEIISMGLFIMLAFIVFLNCGNKFFNIMAGILIMADLWLVNSIISIKFGILSSVAFIICQFLIVDNSALFIPYFIFIGLASNLFNGFNKRVLMFFNFILICVVSFFAIKHYIDMMLLIEMLISMFVLYFVKPVSKIVINDDNRLLPEAVMEIEDKKTFEEEERINRLNNFKIKIKNLLIDNKYSMFFDELYKDRNNILDDIFKVLDNDGMITDVELVDLLKKSNVYLPKEKGEFDIELQKMQINGIVRLINNAFTSIK